MSNNNRKQYLKEFKQYLYENEKSPATIEKYKREAERFLEFAGDGELNRELLMEYREKLQKDYKIRTVNGKISAVNAFLKYLDSELRMKFFRVQKSPFIEEGRELTEADYKKLLETAKEQGKERLYYIMLTMASTGIRVSELKFITVEALEKGKVEIYLKGKTRVILIQKELKKRLLNYASRDNIKEGVLFRTRSGAAVDRSNICHELKKLSEAANVNSEKVFPHNFRHLFARTFYKVEKNLSYLADVLGHSSIETTRIYVAASEGLYRRTLNKMNLIL